MAKRFITAVEIREAAQAGQQTFSIPSGECIVTPMAKDEADRLGIVLSSDGPTGLLPGSGAAGPSIPPNEKLIQEVAGQLKAHLPPGTPSAKLEAVIRDVVAAKLGRAAGAMTPAPQTSASGALGVQLIDHQRLLEGENGPIPVDEKMLVAQAIGSEGDDKLAGGFMVWEKASFTRHVEQPEIAVVLEGELHLDAGGKTLKGCPGDMVYFPKGAVVVYSAPARVKLACVNCI